VSAEHSNAAVQFGETSLLKFFRKLDEGTSPELELLRHVNKQAPTLVPNVLGSIEYRKPRAEPITLGVLEQFIPNQGTAWRYSREEVGRFYETVLTEARDQPPPELPSTPLLTLSRQSVPDALRARIPAYLDSIQLLGKRTADLHRALAETDGDDAFAPEPYSSFDRRSVYQSLRNLTGIVLRTLRSRLRTLPAAMQPDARAILDYEPHIFRRFEPLLNQRLTALRTRSHGDFHLEQVLYTGNDFVFIDFDGGPDKELSERRRKRSPIRDVAGMLRSFDWVAMVSLFDERTVRPADRAFLRPWAEEWNARVAATYLGAYLDAARGASFLPSTEDELALLLDTFVFRKTVHQLSGELRGRGEFLSIPLRALVRMFALTPEVLAAHVTPSSPILKT
jgi:maltose alpha-D-glucosyltransferase/alpha-amylase